MKPKKDVKRRFFKLGKDAASYSDPTSGIVIRHPNEVISIPAKNIPVSEKTHVIQAITAGHIVEVEDGSWEKDENAFVTKLPLPEIHTKVVRPGVGGNNTSGDLEDWDKEEEEKDEEEDGTEDINDSDVDAAQKKEAKAKKKEKAGKK